MERERRDWRLGDLVHLNPEIHDLSPGQTLGKKAAVSVMVGWRTRGVQGVQWNQALFFLARRRA